MIFFTVLNLVIMIWSFVLWRLGLTCEANAEASCSKTDKSIVDIRQEIEGTCGLIAQQKEQTEQVLAAFSLFTEDFKGTLEELALKLETEFTGKPIGMLGTAFLCQRDILAKQ
jgi:hypothetical protein